MFALENAGGRLNLGTGRGFGDVTFRPEPPKPTHRKNVRYLASPALQHRHRWRFRTIFQMVPFGEAGWGGFSRKR